jgi:serine/threonine protein kinase
MKIPGYQVHKKIGKGGMATVFLATQKSFERKVALKMIANSAFGSQQLAERFSYEAKVVASFSHPHIVPVYDVGSVGQYHYLSMDYLQGGDLSTWIKAGLEHREVEQIITQMAQALHYAHRKGYVHRDIKPDNILFREDNSAVLTDFGIAKPLNDNSNDSEKGMVVGTPAYMSPEQSQGKTIDARSDLYSLGVMFYQMLTKELPYKANEPVAMALKHFQDPIPKMPIAQRRYQNLIDKLLAKEPAERFQSGLELCKAIERLADNPDAAPLASTSAQLKLVDKEDTQSNEKQEPGLTFEETRYRKLGVITRYAFIGNLRSQEPQHLAVLFSQFTTELAQWLARRERRCGKLELTIHANSQMSERLREKLEILYNEKGPYILLQSIDFNVTIIDNNGKLLEKISY